MKATKQLHYLFPKGIHNLCTAIGCSHSISDNLSCVVCSLTIAMHASCMHACVSLVYITHASGGVGDISGVSLLMALNLTVAIGTLNLLIFYANILGASGGTIISSSTKDASVFISWLNLEEGFDICFYQGIDTYWKTWLQLPFLSYVILLNNSKS